MYCHVESALARRSQCTMRALRATASQAREARNLCASTCRQIQMVLILEERYLARSRPRSRYLDLDLD